MNGPNHERGPRQDVPLLMFLVVWSVMVISLSLMRRNVVYTEGEVMQGLFTLLVIAIASCILIGFRRRTIAMWCVTLLGGGLLVWQAYQTRKWAIIHEDIVGFVRFAEESKIKTGEYPQNCEGYPFATAWVKSHIRPLHWDETNGFRITYFMNQPGITYWYSSKSGFGYYPD